jgi:hypothetical protein
MTAPYRLRGTWHRAVDGRWFRVYKGSCVCSPCWQARCECGHKLTAHCFDQKDAQREALEALSTRDPLNRRDFAHPTFQCHPNRASAQEKK